MKTFAPSSAVATLALAALLTPQAAHGYSDSFDLMDHTSQLNHYHSAATELTEAETALDDSCSVDMVFTLMRHGTRYPSTGSYSGIKAFADKVTEILSWDNTTMADELAFLATWNLTTLIPDPTLMVENISARGLEEAFDFGEALHTKYSDLYQKDATVWTNAKARVVYTAQSFMKGFFGADYDADHLIQVSDTDKTLGGNTLTPINTCANYADLSSTPQSEFAAATNWSQLVADKINAWWPALELSSGEATTVMDLCMYQMNFANDDLSFCKLFSDDEWEQYAYNKDLGYYYGSGFGVPLSPTVGFPYAEQVTTLLNETETTYCQKIFPAFSQDTQLNVIYTGFGLNYDDESAYPTTSINTTRNYKSSRNVAMGSRIVTERVTCDGEKYVRFMINDAVVPHPECQSGPGLSCPLADWVNYMAARKEQVGDFVTECGSTSGSSTFSLFEDPVKNLCDVSSC